MKNSAYQSRSTNIYFKKKKNTKINNYSLKVPEINNIGFWKHLKEPTECQS